MAMSRTRKIVLIVSGVALFLILGFVLIVALFIASLRGTEPHIRNNSVLALKIKGSLPDYVPDDPVARMLGAQDSSLTNLLLQIKKAKVDKRIGGILLDIEMSDVGWGKADEIREAIKDFRASGKPVYAYMEFGTNKEYYIATACDKIYVSPPGDLFTIGLAADVMFLRGSLDKLGIYPEVVKIGKYKNAPDQFTEKQMTEAHREVINAMLDDIFNRFVDTIAATRNKSQEEVRAFIDNSPQSSQQAKDSGFIDGVSYRDDVEVELKKRLGYKDADKLNVVSAGAYHNIEPESLGLNTGEKIAIIYASGAIGSGKSNTSPFGSQSVGSDTMVKAINDAVEDKTIKAIVIRVDSPGGSSYASDVIWHAVENARKKNKPVVVSMGDVAASGGYYIACNANRIIAEPSTITGSIGIFAGKPVMKGFYDWLGISSEYVLRGKNAGMFRETDKFTPEERAKFEEWVKGGYEDFIRNVAKGRSKDVGYIDSIAQGRVWMASQAKEKGLVDEFGGLDRAVEVAKQLANIPADKSVRRIILPYPRTFLEQLFNTETDEENAKALQQQRAVFQALPADMRRAFQYAAMFDQMKQGDTMALMPYDLRIK
jgi:protease-4